MKYIFFNCRHYEGLELLDGQNEIQISNPDIKNKN